MSIDDKAIPGINNELNSLSAEERIAWAWEKFGAGLVLSTSFGLQSGVMLDLTRRVSSEIPVIFVDTGYLFAETYQYANKLQEKLSFKAHFYSAKMSPAYQVESFGELWEQGKEGMKKYNFINKKEPMERALQELGANAWLSGLRKAQSEERSKRPFIEKQDGVIKIYPILDWDDRKTYKYLPDNEIPYHPLEGMGYESLGDHHSTVKYDPSKSSEESRHGGHGRECGLHLDLPEGLDFSV
jgi:phosphoadenosine phosphosulfate reductase